MTDDCSKCKWGWDCHGRYLENGKCVYRIGKQAFSFYEPEDEK